MSDKPNGWAEWSKYVLKELERLSNSYENLDKCVDKISIEIAQLKVKAGVWGAIAGAIPVIIVLGIYLLKSLK